MRRRLIVRPAALFILLLSLAPAPLISRDASAEKINKLYEIKQKIRKAWDSVGESKEEEKAIRASMEKINETIGSREKDLRDYEKRMSRTQAEIGDIASEIEMLKGELDSQKQHLKEYINFLYKQQHGDNAFVLASATDYQDLSRKSKYMSLISNYENRVIQKYVNDIQEINSRQRSMEALIAELEAGKEEAREKKKVLQADLSKKGELLAGVRDKQVAYEKKIRELEASSKKIQGVVAGAEKKKIPEAITGSGFVSAKGHLPWPVRGKVLVPYGEYKDTIFNISTFKNGIEIEAGPDAAPLAVAGGRVIFASPFENYGMLLIIDHGNGYNTLYGNLSDIPLRKNDLLIQGTDLGKITRSKLLNTPALYFEIRHNGRPVDPAEWLEKRG
ncbi:MAG: peptidoglycan DD-metalloendopeptidase family protein [Nitrospirae bacterium]|nr:peptidoglycan DD-metalloendopeptidase family protein [Nitrospirota bacterium]